MNAHHYLEKIVMDLEQSSTAKRKTADEFEQLALEFRKKADDDALDADELRAIVDLARAAHPVAVTSSSIQDEPAKAVSEDNQAGDTERGPDEGGAVRIAADCADDAPNGIKMYLSLHLTVPHLSNAVKGHAEADQKGIVVAYNNGCDGNGNAGDDKCNGPITVIVNVLVVHRRPHLTGIRSRVNMSENGEPAQEVNVPCV